MPECQFQRIVTQYFSDHSRLVAKWPLPFFIIPLLITGGLCYAFSLNLENLENSGGKNGDKLSLFLPDDVPAVENLKELSELFPPQDAIRDNYDMFGATFAYVVIEDITANENVLRNYPLLVANDLNKRINDIRVKLDSWYEAGFEQLCFLDRTSRQCVQHPIVFLLNGTNPMTSVRYFLGYPKQRIGDEMVDNTLTFGSVTLKRTANGDQIDRAKALRVAYVLRQAGSANERAMSVAWQNAFTDLVSKLRYPGINLYYTAAVSWSQEIERNGAEILPYMPLLFIVLVVFSVCSCFTADWVVSKPLLGICGIINALLAVAATMGTLVAVGYPFLTMVFIMPFLIMSISVDNMFLMLNSWRATHPLLPLEDRMSKAIGETAVSILITALTDGLSFSVGSVSKFPAVRIFCTYCALAILYAFLFQMTWFTSCMALIGRREAANRHCVTFQKVDPRSESAHRSFAYRLFCTGGLRTSKSLRTLPTVLSNQIVTEFFSTTYANMLKIWSVKAVVIISYVVYIGIGCFGLMQLPIGLDLKSLVPADSYLSAEIDSQNRHFTAYGGFSFCVTKGAEIKYYDPTVKRHVLALYNNLTRTEFTDNGDFWLVAFNDLNRNRVFNNEREFLVALQSFLQQPAYVKYRNDIHFDPSTGVIDASKMMIRMRNVGFKNHTRIVRTMRAVFDYFGLPGFIYESSFLLVDQQQSTIENVCLNVVIAVIIMIIISIMFMPRLITAVWIGISIFSINLGVVSGLAFWDVRLDIVSMITIVMSIGFSVDFAAHVTYHFMISTGGEHRLNKAMKFIGTPVMQAAGSTVLGVMSLAPVESYMVRTFVKTVVLVVGLGLLHGLLFLPVFLSILVPASEYLESTEIYKDLGHYLASNVPKYFHQIRNKRMQCYQAEAVDNRAMREQIRIETIGGSTSLSQRNRLGGLHGSKRYPPMESPVISQPRRGRSNSADLYDFLKFKRQQQETPPPTHQTYSQGRSASSDDLYSEPISFNHSRSQSSDGINHMVNAPSSQGDSDLPLIMPSAKRFPNYSRHQRLTPGRSQSPPSPVGRSAAHRGQIHPAPAPFRRHEADPNDNHMKFIKGMTNFHMSSPVSRANDRPRHREMDLSDTSSPPHNQSTRFKTDASNFRHHGSENHGAKRYNPHQKSTRRHQNHRRRPQHSPSSDEGGGNAGHSRFPPPPHLRNLATKPYLPHQPPVEQVRIALGGQMILRSKANGHSSNDSTNSENEGHPNILRDRDEQNSDVFTVIQPTQHFMNAQGRKGASLNQPTMRTFGRGNSNHTAHARTRSSTIIEAYETDMVEIEDDTQAIHL